MAQSVTNEALWVKLLEIDKKLDKYSVEQETPVPTQERAENKPDFTGIKDDIITKISDEIARLGRSSDSHFDANKKNIVAITETMQKVWNIVSRIRKQQREAAESQEASGHFFNFWLFKVRKTSLVIAALGLLVLILTLFCMKQQNDYSLLMDEYYRQSVEVRMTQAEADSLKNTTKTYTYKRQK